MRFDVHVRRDVAGRLEQLAEQMSAWEAAPRVDDEQAERIRSAIVFFDHCTRVETLRIGGVDGSGDYPSLSYADSFVYVTVAHGTTYAADPASGLREQPVSFAPLVDFTWMPEDQDRRRAGWDSAFESLSGRNIEEVIASSDYRLLKEQTAGRPMPPSVLQEALIRPHASDAGNVRIQLRSTAELGAALRLIEEKQAPHFVLLDGTLSLPLVTRTDVSLFHEHLKRLCCVEASRREIGFFALSKSHGLPSIDALEGLGREVAGLPRGQAAEHWYLRVPSPEQDGWELGLAHGRQLPPVGAVTYLVRFHRTTPVLRLDMDIEYWSRHVQGDTKTDTVANECRIFEHLDYAGHDQRCYGYPYPIKAGHDRASLTKAERLALRKQIIDAAIGAGMKRSLFRSAAQATGHE